MHLIIKPIPNFSNYYASSDGNIYKLDMSIITPFNSNGYYQVHMKNDAGTSTVKGVHQLVASAFIDEYKLGDVVHHIDGDKHNNAISNLQVQSRSEHSRNHANADMLIRYIDEHGPHNKGKKMSTEFCEKCRQSALKRGFNGDQYTKKTGT